MLTALLATQLQPVLNAVQDSLSQLQLHVLLALPIVVYARMPLLAQLAPVASITTELTV